MKVKFVEFYQGVKTYPYGYQPGEEAEVDADVGRELIAMGKAEEVKPPAKKASKADDK